jgi:exopolysaccharide/PEP-CTERM locus tyrosine autokinase
MSLIERAVELLRPGPHGQQGRSAPGGKGEMHRQDVIDRAAAQLLQEGRQAPAGARTLSESESASGPAQSFGAAPRHFAVDRNRLRSLSLTTPDGERTALAESFRRIKRQILSNIAEANPATPSANLVLVTSALPGEGKTYCAINLAISMALERDSTVLLADADVAKPSIPRALGLEADGGLMDALLDPQLALGDVLWKTDIGGLTVLPAGTAHRHATELLASDAMRSRLQEMAERHDVVVFDSPPLLAASEAAALANRVGQIVVVVEAGKTSEAALKHALARIDASRIAGLLLNKVQATPLQYTYDGYG